MSIEKPPCFGHPCLGARSPCQRCGVVAACARRLTVTAPFGLLMFPRIDPPAAAGGDELPAPMLFDAAIEAEVSAALSSRAGLVAGRGRVWRWKRERVLVLREASASRTAIEFLVINPPRVVTLPSTRSGVQVAPSRVSAVPEGNVTVAQIAEARALAPGTIVWAPGWRPVVDVAVELTQQVYQGGDCG